MQVDRVRVLSAEAAWGGVPAVREAGAATDGARVGLGPLATIARTHQIDDLLATQWDRTRCAAAGAVSVAALAGPTYLDALARDLEARLERRLRVLDDAAADLVSPDDGVRDAARADLLVELHHHVHAFDLTLRSAAEQAGFWKERPDAPRLGVGGGFEEDRFVLVVGEQAWSVQRVDTHGGGVRVTPVEVPAAEALSWYSLDAAGAGAVGDGQLDPKDLERIDVPDIGRATPWMRSKEPAEAGAPAPLALEERDLALGHPSLVLALYQMLAREQGLIERMQTALRDQLDAVRSVRRHLGAAPAPELLQRLADAFIFVHRKSERGLNEHEAAVGLRGAGLTVEALPAAVPYADMARSVAPGEALLIQGIGHACVMGRTDDGELYLYDSEGIGGDPRAPCVAVIEPGAEAPEILARYGRFEASHRVRRPKVRELLEVI